MVCFGINGSNIDIFHIFLMAKPVFQVLRNLLVLDRASSACKKVFRYSQSALCTTTVGSESMYSWFDSV